MLLAAVRDGVPIDHGRIDLTGEVTAARHHVLRIGALVTFELSAQDRFQEQAERWVDVPSRRLLPAGIAGRLARAATSSGEVPSDPGQLLPAIAEAHRLIDEAALARRETLAGEVNGAHQAERARAVAYYADAAAAIERRLATAPADRRAVLAERLRGTREEEARRLAEIAEKYAASHAIRPYRLHVVEVPALRLPTDVRRGDRRYPMTFDWLLPAGAFAPVRCPSCGGEAPLVAGKQKLGCQTCLPPRAEAAPVPPAKAARPAGPATAAAKEKAAAPQPRPAPTAPTAPAACAVTQARCLSPARRPRCCTGCSGLRGLLRSSGWHRMWPRTATPPESTSSVPARTSSPGSSPAWTSRCTPYFLSHRSGLITEVLPCPVYPSGELWRLFWHRDHCDESWTRARVPRAASLDLVGRALFTTGPRWHGLAVTARSAAAWERTGDVRQRLLAGRPPLALAAAVDRLIDYRAGGPGTFASAAEAYHVAEQELRAADRALRPLLALSPGRPW